MLKALPVRLTSAAVPFARPSSRPITTAPRRHPLPSGVPCHCCRRQPRASARRNRHRHRPLHALGPSEVAFCGLPICSAIGLPIMGSAICGGHALEPVHAHALLLPVSGMQPGCAGCSWLASPSRSACTSSRQTVRSRPPLLIGRADAGRPGSARSGFRSPRGLRFGLGGRLYLRRRRPGRGLRFPHRKLRRPRHSVRPAQRAGAGPRAVAAPKLREQASPASRALAAITAPVTLGIRDL